MKSYKKIKYTVKDNIITPETFKRKKEKINPAWMLVFLCIGLLVVVPCVIIKYGD